MSRGVGGICAVVMMLHLLTLFEISLVSHYRFLVTNLKNVSDIRRLDEYLQECECAWITFDLTPLSCPLIVSPRGGRQGTQRCASLHPHVESVAAGGGWDFSTALSHFLFVSPPFCFMFASFPFLQLSCDISLFCFLHQLPAAAAGMWFFLMFLTWFGSLLSVFCQT